MELVSFLILCVLLFITWQIFRSNGRKNKFPGPGLLESILSLLKNKDNLHFVFQSWTKKYGKLYTVFLGPDRYFILSDPTLVKEAFTNVKCNDRPTVTPLDPFFVGSKGIVGTNGVPWSDHRQFSISTLRNFNIGKSESTLSQVEIQQLIQIFAGHAQAGEPFLLSGQFMVPSFNALWITIANRTFSRQEDGGHIQMFASHIGLLQQVSLNPLLVFNENIAKKVPWLPSWKKFRESYIHVSSYMDEVIQEHKKSIIKGQPRDYIDSYLDKVDEVTDKNSVFYKGEHLKACLFDFFYVGSTNVAATLEWAVVHMVRNPKIQAKVRAEVARVVGGKDKTPNLTHRPFLPYLNAVLQESFRLTPVASTGIPHKVVQDFQLGQWALPKGSHLICNTYTMHHDPGVWPNPEEFKPERFLVDGEFKPSDNVIPFLLGNRVCIGRHLATDFVFLIFAGIFHKFEISESPHHSKPSLEPAGGVALRPKAFWVVANLI